MKSRQTGRRRNTRHHAAAGAIPPVATVTIGWNDLSRTEQAALKRMNRGPYPDLAQAMALRLIDLGLAVARPSGIGISRSGRELVISALLEARRDHMES